MPRELGAKPICLGAYGFLAQARVITDLRTYRINGGHAAESGVVAALLTRHGISGPTDILEGESGFFRAFADQFDASCVEAALGQEFRLMEVSGDLDEGGAGEIVGARGDGAVVAGSSSSSSSSSSSPSGL